MDLLSLTAAFALALSAADDDALVVYSAGIDGLVVDTDDAGLAQAFRLLDDRLAELGHDFGAPDFPEEGLRFAHDLLSRPLVLRIGAGTQGPFRLQLSALCADADDGRGVHGQLQRLLGNLGVTSGTVEPGTETNELPTPFGPLAFGLDELGDRVVFSLSLGGHRHETFRFEHLELPEGASAALHVHYDGRRAGELLAPFLRGNPQAAPIERLLSFLGLVGEDALPLTWTSGFTGEHAVSIRRNRGYTARATERGLHVPESLDASDFRRLPADATIAGLVQLPVHGALNLLDQIEPGTSAEVRRAIQGFTSIDAQTDLIDHLGPTAGFFASLESGGAGLASIAAFIECTDSEAVAEALERMQTAAQALAGSAGQGRIRVQRWQHGDAQCSTLTFPGLPIPLEVSWAVSADALWAALNPGTLRVALDQAQAEGDVRDHPHVKRRGADFTEGLARFGFYDAPFYLQRGYGFASFVASGVHNALRSPFDAEREPLAVLPPYAQLARGATPWLSWSRFENGDLVDHTESDRSWVRAGTSIAGTSLTQLYGGVGGIALVSSIAIPKLLSARTSANESAAIATLRSICSAQTQFQWATAVDVDRDGVGEFGTFGELAGLTQLREGHRPLNPPVLPTTFAELQPDGRGGAVVARSGYYFQLWLPDAHGHGITERTNGRPTDEVEPDQGERLFGCYAWPMDHGQTGTRAFFVDHTGDVRAFANREGAFSGIPATHGTAPPFLTVFEDPTGWVVVN